MKGGFFMKDIKDKKRLSYESDGKMGDQKKGNTKDKKDFFNTTQSSE